MKILGVPNGIKKIRILLEREIVEVSNNIVKTLTLLGRSEKVHSNKTGVI